ncbi:MAG: hypothetical protein H7245_23080 [Candidatus Saccharibacteria bacterium]|nr:hypothetical protein [Pseudorhodobacter sp.]
MAIWISAAVISVMGVGALTGLGFAPRADSRLVAAVVPPWAEGGITAVVRTGLAVVDMHWAGHVMILDTGGDAAALHRLRGQGFWLMDASGLRGCGKEG